MSKTQELQLHEVEIHSARGKDVILTKVPEHEINVLRAVHGPSNIVDRGQTEEVDDFPLSAADELGRLQRKYRRLNDQDPVRMVFPGMAYDLQKLGFGAGEESVIPQASVVNRPRTAKKSDDGEAAELRAKLDALQVKYHPRMGVEKLRALVAEAEQ